MNRDENKFADTLGDDLPKDIDHRDPLFEQAHDEIIRNRFARVPSTASEIYVGPTDSISKYAKLLVCTEIVVALFILAIVLATCSSWVLSRREELAAQRRGTREREMQRLEARMKQAEVGLYLNPERILEEIKARMEQLRR